MKKILLFANECQSSIELIESLIAQHFYVSVITFAPFKNKEICIGAMPLQLRFSVTNIANYYNWKDEIPKYDIIINTLSYHHFKVEAQNAVYENFTSYFAKITQVAEKPTIYISQNHIPKLAENSENSMLQINHSIFYVKTGMILNSKSDFIVSLLNSKFIFLSTKILNTKIPFTSNIDISSYVVNVINGSNNNKRVLLSSENFSLYEIISMIKKYNAEIKIIKIPNFIFKIFIFFINFLPKGFVPPYLLKENIAKLTNCALLSNYHRYPKHTLVSYIIEMQAKNLFHPTIE